MQLFGYGVEKNPSPITSPSKSHENPTIRTDRSFPKIHPPKRKEKTKTPAPGHQSSKIYNKNKTLIKA
jgi:hypothetical protein